ncbi:hypothetical protein K1719_038214 [Acacia pycnantha]|nr:hypothetical protein K1719_038214 [Acacia pycnantha]
MGCVQPLFASGGLLDLRSSSPSHMRRSSLLHLQDPNIHNLTFPTSFTGAEATYRVFNASIHKVSLSKDLCRLVVMCSGDLVEVDNDSRQIHMDGDVHGLHCLAYYYILE